VATKELGPPLVVRLGGSLEMLATVELDGQSALRTEKVQDVAADRMLATEFEFFEASSAEVFPDEASASVAVMRSWRRRSSDVVTKELSAARLLRCPSPFPLPGGPGRGQTIC
jgi:hypothetical protein